MNLFKLRHWIVLCMAFAYALAQAAEVIAPAATKARFSCQPAAEATKASSMREPRRPVRAD